MSAGAAGRGRPARRGRDGVLVGRGRPRLLGEPGGRPAGDEPAGGLRRADLRHGLSVLPMPWTRSRRTCRRWRRWRGWRWPIRWSARRPTGRRGSSPRCRRFGAEAVVVSRIPGASHCALEGEIIGEIVRRSAGLPVRRDRGAAGDAMRCCPTLRTRLEALVETVQGAEKQMICAGIDAGSRAIKVVLIDATTARDRCHGDGGPGRRAGRLACRAVRGSCWPTDGVDRDGRSSDRRHRLRPQRHRDRRHDDHRDHLPRARACGISARTRGPSSRSAARTASSSASTSSGTVRDFAMNDRCAAGTGRFLEVVADRLGVDLDDAGRAGRAQPQPAAISSMCVVFAETEIIGLLAGGRAARTSSPACRRRSRRGSSPWPAGTSTPPIVFTGGVARIPGMETALQTALGRPVAISPDPQMTGALGAALLARRQCDNPNG